MPLVNLNSSVLLQMCCDYVHSPRQAQGQRLPLLLPDPALLLPVRQQQQQQQQQQSSSIDTEPRASAVAGAETQMWSAVSRCDTGYASGINIRGLW